MSSRPVAAMHFICRSCRQSISRSEPKLRTFSTSSSRSRIIPTFQTSSSTELDAILLDWRKRVFTPSALSKTHQDLVYKASRASILLNDPGVTVTLSNDEEIKLEPMRRYDRPNKIDSLRRIAHILAATDDPSVWANLPAFLEGMQLAKEPVPIEWLEKMARKAHERGHTNIIKQCAERVKSTGLKLSMKRLTRELMLGYHDQAAKAAFKAPEASAAYKHAEYIAQMLESEHHCGGKLKPGETDMRKEPMLVGVLLELAAARAIGEFDSKDTDRLVGNYAQKLLALAKDDLLQPEEKASDKYALEDWIPMAHGMRLALKVRGLSGMKQDDENRLKMALKSKVDALDKAIAAKAAAAQQQTKHKPQRPLLMLKQLQQA